MARLTTIRCIHCNELVDVADQRRPTIDVGYAGYRQSFRTECPKCKGGLRMTDCIERTCEVSDV